MQRALENVAFRTEEKKKKKKKISILGLLLSFTSSLKIHAISEL